MVAFTGRPFFHETRHLPSPLAGEATGVRGGASGARVDDKKDEKSRQAANGDQSGKLRDMRKRFAAATMRRSFSYASSIRPGSLSDG
jgi:hypothetical protein